MRLLSNCCKSITYWNYNDQTKEETLHCNMCGKACDIYEEENQ